MPTILSVRLGIEIRLVAAIVVIFIFRPGFARLNFPYFLDSDTVEYVINAVNRIAEDGWKLLPLVRG